MLHGTVIIGFRSTAGLTQKDLADRLGVDNSLIAHIEAGRRPVSKELEPKIRELLNIPTKKEER